MRNTFFRYVDKETLPIFSRPNFEKINFHICDSNIRENGKFLSNSNGRVFVIEKNNKLYDKHYGTFTKYIESLGDITISYVQYLMTEPNSKMMIHNDRDMIHQNDTWIDSSACSLNYSYGQSNSYLQFYKMKSKNYDRTHRFKYILKQKNLDMPYIFEGIREKDTKLVAESKYDTKYATLINCAVYHRAVNHSNEPRYVIHFRLVRKSDNRIDIKFQEAKKIFKKHLKHLDLT